MWWSSRSRTVRADRSRLQQRSSRRCPVCARCGRRWIASRSRSRKCTAPCPRSSHCSNAAAPSSPCSPPTMPRSRTCSSRSPEGSSAMSDHPLVQLSLARMREFYREPEAIFWVFGFPIVLAFALGIAFRTRVRGGPPGGGGDRGLGPAALYIGFLLAGAWGMDRMGGGLGRVGASVVQARTKRLLRRFMATPVRRSDYLLSFGVSRLVFLFVGV